MHIIVIMTKTTFTAPCPDPALEFETEDGWAQWITGAIKIAHPEFKTVAVTINNDEGEIYALIDGVPYTYLIGDDDEMNFVRDPKFIVYDPELKPIFTTYARDIETATDRFLDVHPTKGCSIDCVGVADWQTVIEFNSEENPYQIIEEGYKPTPIAELYA